MSQDIVADTLNQMMNAKKAGKSSLSVKRQSQFLLSVLAIGRLHGYIKEVNSQGNSLTITLTGKLNACQAVKPRFMARADEVMKYVRRYLPSRKMGVVIVSTSQGLVTHHTAIEKNIGGSIIAYFY